MLHTREGPLLGGRRFPKGQEISFLSSAKHLRLLSSILYLAPAWRNWLENRWRDSRWHENHQRDNRQRDSHWRDNHQHDSRRHDSRWHDSLLLQLLLLIG